MRKGLLIFNRLLCAALILIVAVLAVLSYEPATSSVFANKSKQNSSSQTVALSSVDIITDSSKNLISPSPSDNSSGLTSSKVREKLSGIKDISVSDGTLISDFKMSVKYYSLSVPYETDKIDFKPVPDNNDASLDFTLNGDKELSVGKNTFKLLVKDSVSDDDTYTIIVTRADKSDETSKPSDSSKPGDKKPGKKTIAITFDDGPGPHTDELLNILDKYKIKATFFVVGTMIAKTEKNTAALKRTSEAGHEIGNHSWNHEYLSKIGKKSAEKSIQKCSEEIKRVTGKYPTLLRPPGGFWDRKVKTYMDMPLAFWTIDPEDYKHKDDPERIANSILSEVEDGSVILLHDLYKSSVEAAEIVIKKLTADGWKFVTVSKLYGYK